MGAGGEDILLSHSARLLFPYSVECKNRRSFAIYKDYDQASNHNPAWEPMLVIKADGRDPLVVVDFQHYLELLRK